MQKFGEYLVVVGFFMMLIGVSLGLVLLQGMMEFTLRQLDWYLSLSIVLLLVGSIFVSIMLSRRKKV